MVLLTKMHKPNLVMREKATQIQLRYIVQNNWFGHFKKPILCMIKSIKITILDERRLKSHENQM